MAESQRDIDINTRATEATVHMGRLADAVQLPQAHAAAAVSLLDAGHTIPFIARYRKELTGGMDDEQLRTLADALAAARALEARRADILRLLTERDQLTPELAEDIKQAATVQRLDDLYRPYRPRRRTRASAARELGLEPLAVRLLQRGSESPSDAARRFIRDGVPAVEDALQGARDIVAEMLSDDAPTRERLRALVWRQASLKTVVRETDLADHYAAYADYSEPVSRIPPHRVLAFNRGEAEQALRVVLVQDEQPLVDVLFKAATDGSLLPGSDRPGRKPSPADEQLQLAAHDAVKRLILPSLEREVRAKLTEQAGEQALKVFRENLRSLLLQRPLRGQIVMGLDPAFRTGVKVAVVDATGVLLETGVIFPNEPQRRTAEAARTLSNYVNKYGVTVVAIGNGTASRETEQFVAAWLADLSADKRPRYGIVDEAGASVYSASAAARDEFPGLDVSERSAVSIARRLQDPLAELVKIEPRSLGVGQYQHDIEPKRLDEQLKGVVEATVNTVGVDLNAASIQLLSYVSGVSASVAAHIVSHRTELGGYTSRRQLMDVKGLGPRTFEQCAGFLQIPDAENALDRTPIHPESYPVAERLLASLNIEPAELGRGDTVTDRLDELTPKHVRQLAAEWDCGVATLQDIVAALAKPGRDPREDLPPPLLRADVLEIDDLVPGMELSGTVRNVVDFGAFVDIGVTQDGLVHISQLADHYVKHPLDVVAVGETVQVTVLEVDKKRGRISLSMR